MQNIDKQNELNNILNNASNKYMAPLVTKSFIFENPHCSTKAIYEKVKIVQKTWKTLEKNQTSNA